MAALKQKWCSKRVGNHIEAWEYKYVRRKHKGPNVFHLQNVLGTNVFKLENVRG